MYNKVSQDSLLRGIGRRSHSALIRLDTITRSMRILAKA